MMDLLLKTHHRCFFLYKVVIHSLFSYYEVLLNQNFQDHYRIYISNVNRNGTILSWVPPFSLDLTGIDPDIVYCVEVHNITCGRRGLIVGDCNVTEPSYTCDDIVPTDTFMSTLSLPEVMWRGQEMERVELCRVCGDKHHITFTFAYSTTLSACTYFKLNKKLWAWIIILVKSWLHPHAYTGRES